ncbi:MAG: saccharopine dehydrogenase family protein, partial [Mesorhizobium sp.]
LADGSLPAQGFIKQEDIALDAFLANRFGRAYAQHEMVSRLAG